MATKRATRPVSGYQQPSCETETESNDASASEEEDVSEDEDAVPPPRSTPANVGTKRSDPSIVTKKNKYATSDSGYSSLTATTASSSQSKKATEQPSTKDKIRQKVAQALRRPSTAAPSNRPSTPRRVSQRHERTGRELRSVESREEAARMSLSGTSTRVTMSRRPSEPVSRPMPGGYPPDSPGPPPVTTVPRAIPRPRASTAAQVAGTRPSTYHAGSAPIVYQFAHVPTTQAPTGQHLVLSPMQQQQQQQQQQHQQQQQQQQQQTYQYYATNPEMAPPPLSVNTSTGYFSGSYNSPAGYMAGSTSGSPYTAGYAYPYGMNPPQTHPQAHPQYQPQYQPPQPQQHPQAQWNQPQGGYSGPLGDYYDQHRRMSLSNSAMTGYPPQGMPYYPEAPQASQYHQLRRMSQSVQHPGPMFRPPRTQTPVDEGVFMEDDQDDPDNFYRGFVSAVDRQMMPPPMRPQSSHRPRLSHARTTSTAHAPHQRLSRGSIEYAPEISPRKTSFELARPPSRPGMGPRVSTSSSFYNQRQLTMAQQMPEPPSPIQHRTRSSSIYRHADADVRLQSAEAYQQERTGGFGPSVATDDLSLSRRATRTSDTGSRGSRGSGSRESGEKAAKRANRQSLDKSRLREQHDGVSLNVGGVRMDLKPGSTMTIKQSNERMQSVVSNAVATQSNSTKPTRESSRVRPERPETKRYISAVNSTRSTKDKGRVEVEVPQRQRRSSSLAPRVGRDEAVQELSESVKQLRLDHKNRTSRTSSRSGRDR